MESFSISVDLKSFFSDLRAKSVIFVDLSCMKKVKDVEKHIKTLLGIESDTYISSHNDFVPGEEDSRVLKTLSSIRLGIQSSSSSNECKNATEDHNGNEEHQDVAPSTKKRKKEKTPSVDLHENFDTGPPLKRKKHKKKRADNEECNHENSSAQQITSDDHYSTTTVTDSLGAIKVTKPTSSKSAIATKASSLLDLGNADESNLNESPNGVFYDNVYKDAHKNAQKIIEEWQKKRRESLGGNSCNTSDAKDSDNDNVTNTSEISVDRDKSDLNRNTDGPNDKPKRKRIRKRKKAAKPETTSQDFEAALPQTQSTPMKPETYYHFKNMESESFKTNSNHIYFPEEAEEEKETSLEKPEEKPGDTSTNTTSGCFDNKTGEEVNNETTNPEDAVENKDSGTITPSCLPTPENIEKPKKYSAFAARGLGKLLSLVRSENPPVFERKKTLEAARQEEGKSKLQLRSKSPVRFPVIAPNASTPLAASPLTPKTPSLSPTGESNVALTPLKTIPDKNMKISFKILKMSDSYCPELSNPIVSVVEDVNPETQDLTLKIISGAEECKKPKGKFDLLDAEATEEKNVDSEIQLNWQDLIEPSVFQ